MDTIDPRTGLEILSDDECWQLLEAQPIGRLAVSAGGRPDIFPVNYVVENRTIVIHTMPGLKLASALFGESVAFEVDSLDQTDHSGWSVVVHGPAHEITGTEPLLEADDLGIEPWADSPKYRFLRITPDEVTGRRVPKAGTT